MAYIEVQIQILDEVKDIVVAELEELGYEGIWDQGTTISAYIPENLFHHKQLYDTLARYRMENSFTYSLLQEVNWNSEWEKNYEPVFIDDRICVRSDFHPKPEKVSFDIIIKPEMAFGTGHHETTRLMMQLMLTMNFKNKSVLDMGTGTGVLAILASLMGARDVLAIDYDDKCVESARENLKYNPVHNVTLARGSTEAIPKGSTFDIVLSNITKNINLTLLPDLVKCVSPNGHLALAGFLNFDLEEVHQNVKQFGFELIRNIHLGDWECLLYQKIELLK
ncbi:MAG: 50S ribosomal protein L11 methyltransferase [Bacteroidetes bacterium]|nr:50S ribosomal protein L11 methyltransferase [Bacteroidota bacterium]